MLSTLHELVGGQAGVRAASIQEIIVSGSACHRVKQPIVPIMSTMPHSINQSPSVCIARSFVSLALGVRPSVWRGLVQFSLPSLPFAKSSPLRNTPSMPYI